MRLPVGRAGTSIRVSFRAGEGALTLYAATVAPAGTGGVLAGAPVALSFAGQPDFTAASGQRVTSDVLDFPVLFEEELYVSFDVEGALAESAIMGFPDSYTWAGSQADVISPPSGTEFPQAIGLDTVEVLAPTTDDFVAIGDSITEGYVDGDVGTFNGHADDYRNAWTTVAQVQLGLPVNNAAVSGQGTQGAIDNLSAEVFTLENVSACLVLIGTNDLGGETATQIESDLTTLVDDLKPFCAVYLCTLLPKQSTTKDFTAINAERQLVNSWIRTQTLSAGVLDTESAVAVPGNPDAWQTGLTSDGIHPSIEGDAVLGSYVAKWFTPPATSTDAGSSQGLTGLHNPTPQWLGTPRLPTGSGLGGPIVGQIGPNRPADTPEVQAPARPSCSAAGGAPMLTFVVWALLFAAGTRRRA